MGRGNEGLCRGRARVPGAYTEGATLDELHANLKEVLQLCLEEDEELRRRPPRFVGVQQIEVA